MEPIAISPTNQIATQEQENLASFSTTLVLVGIQWCTVNRARTITMLPPQRTIQIQLSWLVLRRGRQEDVQTLRNTQQHMQSLLPRTCFYSNTISKAIYDKYCPSTSDAIRTLISNGEEPGRQRRQQQHPDLLSGNGVLPPGLPGLGEHLLRLNHHP